MVLRSRTGGLTCKEPLQPILLLGWHLWYNFYLGAVASAISAPALAPICSENVRGRPAAPSHPRLLCSTLMGCKPFPAQAFLLSHRCANYSCMAAAQGSHPAPASSKVPLRDPSGCCLMYCRSRNMRGLAQQDCLSTRSRALPPLQELFP